MKAKDMLEAITQPEEQREIQVQMGNKIVWKQAIDADADVSWDPARGILRLD